MLHPYGSRLLKRVVQGVAPFAAALLPQLKGKLQEWATKGGAWSVLALLENEATKQVVILRGQSAQRRNKFRI